eukprot:Gregarina_sp_Pseudo_9__5553@NODE_73_length_4587_cov_88_906113_g67_i0_p4_GENE_NODE_73_length_4587_cov_88_906113_g67_i0NODE_73_length_4587_cov_88_906113_g67_i0_p4_ORF_typecomplete_len168_score45_39HIT/PF01230_23/1_8e09Hormone_3/PF00159_18/4_2Hormone_3/PF00159_18/64AAA_assoc/PF14363_6/9_1e02AAA_assoc/PF14363_6/0_38_NODE_73_length_4587_cov_88_906113_g67_i036454148
MLADQSRLVLREFPHSQVLPVLAPINDGHVIVVPKVSASDVADMPAHLAAQLWLDARDTAKTVADRYLANPDTSFTFHLSNLYSDALNESPLLYLHVIPRKPGDFESNDQIYEPLNKVNYYLKARTAAEKTETASAAKESETDISAKDSEQLKEYFDKMRSAFEAAV